jgi:outer membrane immunogenic protein
MIQSDRNGSPVKRYWLATVSSLALVSAASAADAPVVARKAPAAVIAPSWTGPYVGLNGGVAWHRAKANLTDATTATDTGRITAAGATLGGQIGYNWQVQNFVYGLEADINWVDGDGSTTTRAFGAAFSTDLPWLATVRARAGITTSPTLWYITGGLAVGKVKNSVPVLFGGYPTDNDTKTGWTVGAGVEHMLQSAQNWTVKAEVLYVDLGSSQVQGNFGAGYVGRFKNTAVIGRVGLNLKW